MESDKIKKRRMIAIDFSKNKESALRILEDEKKTKEKVRKMRESGIEIKIHDEIYKAVKEVETA